MNLQESIAYARGEAQRFRGDAKGFFKHVAGKYPGLARFLRSTFNLRAADSPIGRKFEDVFAQLDAAPAPKPSPTPTVAAVKAADLPAADRKMLAGLGLEDVGREVVRLATSPSEKISGPVIRGLERSLTAEQKLAEAMKLKPGRERLEALKALKSEQQTAELTSHQERCARTRDAIIERSRQPGAIRFNRP